MPFDGNPGYPIPEGWPSMSLSQAQRVLTAPGAPFEMDEIVLHGSLTRAWRRAPSTLAALAVRAARHGNRLVCIYENERVSYDAHFRAVAELGRWLTSQGVRKGDRVALAMRNLPEWTVIFFAITSIGALVVPLNAWCSGDELEHALIDSGSLLLFCDVERYERLARHLVLLPRLRGVVVCRTTESVPEGTFALEGILGRPADYAGLPDAAGAVAVAIEPDDNAAIFYTSGTTGSPKGALASHRNILTITLSSGYAAARSVLRRGGSLVAAQPRVRLITVPLFHVTGCLSVISGIPAGNTNVLMRKWDPLEALKIIERQRVNITGGVPTIVWDLLDHPDRGNFDLSSLETIAFGGAPGAPEIVRRTRAELHAMPSTGWGMTETLSIVTSLGAEDYLLRPESCGLPLPVAELKIMDLAGTAELPIGEIGELWAKGPMVVQGYWNRPDTTAANFSGGWVRTGDIAKLDESGFCTLVDRAKDTIIRGGENIYSGEVEGLIHAHPAVSDTALVGLPHRTLGEEPAAVVRLRPGMKASEAEIQAWVRQRLAPFKVPVRVHFVSEALVRNASGKLMKSELRSLFGDPKETGSSPNPPQSQTSPEDPSRL